MQSLRWPAEILHMLALGLWLGTVAMTGVAAAVTFPIIRDLDPTLATHASYDGDHWLIVAGHVANAVFLFSDFIQFGCAIVAGVTVLITVICLGEGWRRPAVGMRVVSVFSSLTVFAYSFFVLRQQMNEALGAYWRAAAAGDNETAAIHQTAFDALHPTATALLSVTLACVTVALISGVASLRPVKITTPPDNRPKQGDPVEPALLNKRARR